MTVTILMGCIMGIQLVLASRYNRIFMYGSDSDRRSMKYRSYFYDSSVWYSVIVNGGMIARAGLEEDIPCWLNLLLEFAFSAATFLSLFSMIFLDWRLLSPVKKRWWPLSKLKTLGGPELEHSVTQQIRLGNMVYGVMLILNVIVVLSAMGKPILEEGMTSLSAQCSFKSNVWYLAVLLTYNILLSFITVFVFQFQISFDGTFLLKESIFTTSFTLFFFIYHMIIALDPVVWEEWAEKNYHPQVLIMIGGMASLIMEVICSIVGGCLKWPISNRIFANVKIEEYHIPEEEQLHPSSSRPEAVNGNESKYTDNQIWSAESDPEDRDGDDERDAPLLRTVTNSFQRNIAGQLSSRPHLKLHSKRMGRLTLAITNTPADQIPLTQLNTEDDTEEKQTA